MTKVRGFLYFVESKKNGLFKIEVTRESPLGRLLMIQAGCPYEAKVHSALYYEDCHEKECEFRNLLVKYKACGEWYEIDVSVLEELIIQEIVRSRISDINILTDAIVPSYIMEEAGHRLAKINIALH